MVKFVCREGSEFDWAYYENIRLKPDIEVFCPPSFGDSWITIQHVQLYHDGIYSCYGKDIDGEYFADEVTLRVTGNSHYILWHI